MNLQYTAQKGIVLNDKDEILFIIHSKAPHTPHIEKKHGLPGGKIDFGESPNESFIREVEEETGLIVDPGPPFYIYNWQYKKDFNDIQITAVMRICQHVGGEIMYDTKEENETVISETKWIPFEEVLRLPIIDDELPGIKFFLKNRKTLLKLTKE
jgi:mutator protein MutT